MASHFEIHPILRHIKGMALTPKCQRYHVWILPTTYDAHITLRFALQQQFSSTVFVTAYIETISPDENKDIKQ